MSVDVQRAISSAIFALLDSWGISFSSLTDLQNKPTNQLKKKVDVKYLISFFLAGLLSIPFEKSLYKKRQSQKLMDQNESMKYIDCSGRSSGLLSPWLIPPPTSVSFERGLFVLFFLFLFLNTFHGKMKQNGNATHTHTQSTVCVFFRHFRFQKEKWPSQLAQADESLWLMKRSRVQWDDVARHFLFCFFVSTAVVCASFFLVFWNNKKMTCSRLAFRLHLVVSCCCCCFFKHPAPYTHRSSSSIPPPSLFVCGILPGGWKKKNCVLFPV